MITMENTVIASFTDTYWFGWFVLPALIFCARILDVSIGTVRFILVARGYKYLAPLAGFFEVLIWILVIRQIFNNLNNPVCYIAYAAGFAAGNYVGMVMAEALSLGMVMVRVLASDDPTNLVESFSLYGYSVTTLQGKGIFGPTNVLFTIVNKKELPRIVRIIKDFNPEAFYTIEEVDSVSRTLLPRKSHFAMNPFMFMFRPFRKGK